LFLGIFSQNRGGVIGDDGLEGIKLAQGEAHLAVQW
jgi:predicted enzyme involved in methoxymalonyl-ACP biosynthesis